jgi:hypothetical protein
MQRVRRIAPLLFILTITSFFPAWADIRTRTIRLVPETDWSPSPSQSLAIEVVNHSSHAASEEYATLLKKELEEQFGLVLKFDVNPKAATKLRFEISDFDPGNSALRFGVGFGLGKAYVGGSVEVIEKGKTIGRLLFSVQPTLPGPPAMARETGAPLALKIQNGERDKELHKRKKKKK